MRFEYLKFTNYRPYYGEQLILFKNYNNKSTSTKKNIVLIGGLNGHGKTSLINSIFIALYGHRYFKSQSEYNNFISDCVNKKHVNEGGKSGSIELAFSDDTGNYAIEVIFEKGQLGENRKVFSLNADLNKVKELHFTMEEYNDFIDSRIPLDVAQFFIFDAEKIRELVGEQDNDDTKKAIQKIISLELYRQLLKDLDKIHYDYTRELRSTTSANELEEIFSNIEKITIELDELQEKANRLNEELKIKTEEEITVEQERRRLLANASLTKQALNKSIGEYEQKINQIDKGLNHSISNLPIIILQPFIKELKEQIKKEREYSESVEKEKIKFAPYEEFISQLINVDITPSLTKEQKKQLILKGKEIWAKLNNIRRSIIENQITILHDLSHKEFQSLAFYPEEKNTNIKELFEQKQKYEKQLNHYYAQLENAPEEIDTTEQDKKIKELNQEKGEIRSELKNINKKLQSLRNEKFQLTNKYTRKYKEFEKVGPIQKRIDLLESLIKATEEFIEKVTISKAKQLKKEIEVILNQLFRKLDLQTIEFDDKNFTLTIYNEYGDPIDLNSRSEGEKQLIALAMIWALTKVSGSNFPFVIDTPLARLDSIHRSNLVNHYFTKLSDQVIILSTDTEITSDFYQELKPFIEQEYILEFNPDENFTEIRKGYFFDQEDLLWHV